MSNQVEGTKQKLPVWMWIVVAALFLFAAVSFATFGPDALEGPEPGRPIDQVVDHVQGDMLDVGGGTTTFFDSRGLVWKCEPQFLGERAQ